MKKTTLFKTVLLLCALVVGSSSVWAQDRVTIASFTMSSSTGWSCDAEKQSTTYYKMFSGKTIVSPSLSFSNYTDIKIQVKARKLGGPSNAQKVITVYQGTTSNVLATYDGPSGTSLAYQGEKAISPADGTITVACLGASSDKGCGISEVTITGVEDSSDPSSDASFGDETPSMDIKDGYTFSQAVSTAAGYTGAITYSMTANTAGATINAESGLVTVTKAGSVTVKANAAAVKGSWAASSATYTLTVNDTRAATTTTISTTGLTNTEIQNGTAAGKLTASVIAGSSDVDGATVTWASSNPAIATVDEEGNVTLVQKGTTTITATYEGTLAYKPSSDTYELTVTNSAVITINLSNTLFGCGTGNIAAEQKTTVDNVTITTGCTSSASSKTYYASDHVRFYADSYLVLEAPNGYIITDVALNRYNTDTWNPDKVSITTGDGELSGSNPLLWNGFASEVKLSYSGQCRTSSIDVTLVQIATITLAAACTDGEKYYGTYSNSKAFIVPEGLTVSEIKVEEGKLSLSNYATGETVPANTGVMVAATSAGDKTVTLTTGGTSKLGSNNMLKASGDDGIDAATMNVANTKFYRLTMADGKPGFWWKADGGASFDLAANKAYLAVPEAEAQAARGFSLFDEGETTGISATLMNNERMNNEVYNLNGQRVAQPTKGLYIVNGKKVVIK